MANSSEIIPIERIQNSIYLIRKQKVMLDKDLAALYGVTTKRLNEQVKVVFEVLEKMLAEPEKPRQPLSFQSKKAGHP